jgi:replicative DNA helicase
MYPNSIELEKSVLGCLLLGKLDYIIKLSENDFLNEATKHIYNTMRHMYDKKQVIDPISVSDAIHIDNPLEYITNIITGTASPENISYYLERLKTYTIRRDALKAVEKVRTMALEGNIDSLAEFKSDIQQLFDFKIDSKREDNRLSEIMLDVFSDIESKYNAKDEDKLFTGFYDLDKITAGLHPEELTLIAARPGVGKTAFALQLMINISRKGCKCLFVSREMSNIQIAKRVLANLAVVDGHKLRFCKSLTDTDWEKMADALIEINELPVEINDSLSSVQEIRAYCRELKNNDKIDLLIVDYLQLCKSLKKTENRRQEVEDISRQLKEMTLEFAIPIIALSQLSRESVSAGEPELHHLRESGSLEQDADNVIFLHVPKDTDETAEAFDIKVIVAKQRNGPVGYIFLKYFRRTFKLCNIKR